MLPEEAIHVAAGVHIVDLQRETLTRLTEKKVRCDKAERDKKDEQPPVALAVASRPPCSSRRKCRQPASDAPQPASSRRPHWRTRLRRVSPHVTPPALAEPVGLSKGTAATQARVSET